jgi:cell division septal protein FtsQ
VSPSLTSWGAGQPVLEAPAAGAAAGVTAGAGGGGGMGGGRVLDFRRRGAPPRRRRRSLLLSLAKPLGVAVLTVGLPLALATWVLTGRRFQLHAVTVSYRREPALQGIVAPRVAESWVRQALAPLTGRNLLRLPLAEVRQRLGGNAWIASAEVTKELPDRLRVTLAERHPVVLLRHGEELLFADAAGRPIAPVASAAEREAARRQGLLVVRFSEPAFAVAAAAGAPPALPTLPAPLAPLAPMNRPALAGLDAGAPSGLGAAASSGFGAAASSGFGAVAPAGFGVVASAAAGAGGIAGALRLADQLRRLRPAWTSALTEIEVMDEDDYRLRIDGLPCPLLVRGSRLADNLARFEQLLPELKRRYPALSAVDLRFARRIVVQPAPASVPRPSPPAPRSAQPSAGA